MATGRTTSSLLADAAEQIAGLFRIELQLFRTEMSEKASQATRALVLAAAGAVLALAALFLLLGACVDGLTALGLQRYAAGLVVGAAAALIAAGLILKASSDLKPSRLRPERSLRQFGKTAFVAKAQVK